MRACGYAFEKKAGDELAFVRRISGYDYPKFHAYVRTVQIPAPEQARYRASAKGITQSVQHESQNAKRETRGAHEMKQLIINVHLDQKKPSYRTSHAHSADYEGDQIAAEAERITNLYTKNLYQ